MKIQINRFSTHQTAKVFAILIFVSSLLFVLPFMMISFLSPTPETPDGTPFPAAIFSTMFLMMPVFQGIMGYIMVRFGLWVYNLLSPKVGGFEFEYKQVES